MIGDRSIGPGAASVPATVDGDDSIALLHQHGNEVAEIIGIPFSAVQQQHRDPMRARTPLGKPNARAIDSREYPDGALGQLRRRWKRLPERLGPDGGRRHRQRQEQALGKSSGQYAIHVIFLGQELLIRSCGDYDLRIATYNVNSVNARLPVLLRWLNETQPDIACLQELKAPQDKFPEKAIREAGYGVIWHGQKSYNGVAILARGRDPVETQRGLPGDPNDLHSRYIEASVGPLVVGCLYLPNGNPAPGPKFDYKLGWFERLAIRASDLVGRDSPVVLAGDYNVIPTEIDVYKPERWVDDALFRPETRAAYHRLLELGLTDAVRALHPGERIYTFWDYFRNAYGRDAGLRIDHLLLNPFIARHLRRAGVDRYVRGWEKTSDHAPTWIELEGSP